ncbi:hypothetical protein CB0940_07078 [Cercospora beticola]|uniref:Uncharacterized protein n=1 Tax=Cercospora beticola TaxID=122368 RepID=A0A2G5H7W5_CERBT|nr:hypothetical protein CB0940_07078 [Cercospora beticola]PIA88624.1 hypothetical protein CB0940_07078 [Cercospora beticola]WPB03002.1 hypothetical protein RHO25_007638 [Cercospora beticola]CAK1358295.1 unnamed protein product [Cercospora beticola]
MSQTFFEPTPATGFNKYSNPNRVWFRDEAYDMPTTPPPQEHKKNVVLAKVPKLYRDTKIAIRWHFRRLLSSDISAHLRALCPQGQVRDVTYWAEVSIYSNSLQEPHAGAGKTTVQRVRKCRQIRPGSGKHNAQLMQAHEWLEEQRERYGDAKTEMVMGWYARPRGAGPETSWEKWGGEWWDL